MSTDDRHPLVPEKACQKCQATTVHHALTTKYVVYYHCKTCLQTWSEPHPPGFTPPPDTWDEVPDVA